jgi:hypothetical protein
MRKQTFNRQTLKFDRGQTMNAFRKCYLQLQHCLLTFLEGSRTKEEKLEFRRQIKELGETYKQGIDQS